ncbi:MAG: hypothetical protein Q6362_002680 [Candidatus Wukongarchaeota archaeon]|nr:hypothetical protein [Candidatus Wukongarchaeota archaeon]
MTELKVSRVIIYRHGIAFIEMTGTLEEKIARLFFEEDDMNDLLKSFAVSCYGEKEAGVVSVQFGSKIDVGEILERTGISISPESGIKTLFETFTGERVRMKISGEEEKEGRIIGVEEFAEEKEGRVMVSFYDEKTKNVVFINVDRIESMELLDLEKAKDFAFYLETQAEAKKRTMKPVTIHFDGEPPFEVLIRYAIESPAWKTTYRLFKTSIEEKSFLEGFAIVDNPRGIDWEDVQLTLVTGLPISFEYDSYSPLWMKRPVVKRREDIGLRPIIPEAELEKAKAEGVEEEYYAPAAMPPPSPRAALASVAMDKELGGRPVRAKSDVKVETTKVELGGFFAYSVNKPVTVKRNQSALVPILREEVETKKRYLFNEEAYLKNPLMCIELKNTSQAMLEEGPITLFADGAYSGEGILPTMKKENERLIPFVLEQEININVEREEKTEITSVTLDKKYRSIVESVSKVLETTYIISNSKDEDAEVILEHSKHWYGEVFEPFEAPELYQETPQAYRWLVNVERKATRRFGVTLKRIVKTYRRLEELTDEQLEKLKKEGVIDEEIFAKLMNKRKLIKEREILEQDITALKEELETLYREQERLRENIKTLGTSHKEEALKTTFLGKLESMEKTIEDLKETILNKQKEKTKVEKELKK